MIRPQNHERGLRYRVRKAAALFIRHDELDWLPYRLVLQALLFGCAIAALDFLVGEISSGLSDYEASAAARREYVGALLTFTGIPTALLLALASFALPSLSPAISSSFPLLFLRYPWWPLTHLPHRLFFVPSLLAVTIWILPFGDAHAIAVWFAIVLISLSATLGVLALRTNLLHFPLLLAGTVTTALVVMSFLGGIGVRTGHLLSLGVMVALLLIDAGAVVALVIWLMRLRQSAELIDELLRMGENILGHVRHTRVGALGPATNARLAQQLAREDEVLPSTAAQRNLQQVLRSLGQVALHSMHEDQGLPARHAAAAIAHLHALASDIPPRDDWLVALVPAKRGFVSVATPWIDTGSISLLKSILLSAAEEHFYSVGSRAAQHLLDVALLAMRGPDRAPRAPDDVRAGVAVTVVESFADAFDECVQFDEINLRDRVLFFTSQLIETIAALPDSYRNQLQVAIAKDMRIAGRLAVSRNDVGALRALLTVMRPLRTDELLRVGVIRAVYDLGGLALATRSYGAASVLIDWLCRFDDSGEFVPAIATGYVNERERAVDETVPPEASRGYVQVFSVLVCARARADQVPCWPDAVLGVIQQGMRGLVSGEQRCRIVLMRLNESVEIPRDLAERWRLRVSELV